MAVDEAAAAGTGGVSDLLNEGTAVGSLGIEGVVEGRGGCEEGQENGMVTKTEIHCRLSLFEVQGFSICRATVTQSDVILC